MPVLTRWLIKSAMVCLALALAVATTSAACARTDYPWIHTLTPVYIHLFMFGWVTQLIFGVAYWMFPRYSVESHRGPPVMGVAMYVALNLGLLLRVAAEPAHALHPGPAGSAVLVVSAILQLVAVILFALLIWGRVREP